ncbi:PREDICTED: protein EXECUTER 1, chloroplastic-like [Ipomoea nil]|uniref:protein EXECUTER 1, chloroplastic-like n=1 Tax=Ipomoea nil TaxID=35883 RepID=UPI000901839C|nr:PREDICTED: protein EXECUTER 1, chloroplastic-like [Ipomoea nil]
MASIAPPTFRSPSTCIDPNFSNFNFSVGKFTSRLKRPSPLFFSSHSLASPLSAFKVSEHSLCCRCRSSDRDGADSSPSASENVSPSWKWDSAIQEAVKNVLKRFDSFVNSNWSESESGGVTERKSEDGDWDWERWKKHFTEVEEQEQMVSILKSQLAGAIGREDYEEAAKLKVGIAAAATNDTVGKVISHLNNAVKEELYADAAFIRDHAGAGLVGWWSGISDDCDDPYGRIIHISAEHGRYVAKTYSPRQLASAVDGAPIFEIFLRMNKHGNYKQQAVYLKQRTAPQDSTIPTPMFSGTRNLDSLSPTEYKDDLFGKGKEVSEDDENRDDDSGFENKLRDMVPGVKVKVLKVTAPAKVDRDLISKVIEQVLDDDDDEDEDEEDIDLETVDSEVDEDDFEEDIELEVVDAEVDIKVENNEEQNVIELDTDTGTRDNEEQSQVAIKVVVGRLVQNMSSSARRKDLLRIPATLERKSRLSFTFSVEDTEQTSSGDGESSSNRKPKLHSQRSMDHLMLDLAKFIGKGKIPEKMLKDVGKLINLTLNQARNHQLLSKSTTFNRIEIPLSTDPLNGLYIGTQGLYGSEVIHLRRRFGQWKEDKITKNSSNIEFYEYVEAVKLTGDPYVPAGQIAFRAKVGKQNQLPHKGIIPEEFGVIARYRGQGRLAEPGFQNPRWVDGELVILDGKYIKGGPVVGFVYWAPEYHFLMFFHRLRLQD